MSNNPYYDPSVPSAPATTTSSFTLSTAVKNESGARTYLSTNQWNPSMQNYFFQNIARIPIRYFICDDSGSMSIGDGSRITKYGNSTYK